MSAIAVEDNLTRLGQLGLLGATRMTARDKVPQHFAAGFPQSHHSGQLSGVGPATLRAELRLAAATGKDLYPRPLLLPLILQQTETYFPGIPLMVQRSVIRTLAALARRVDRPDVRTLEESCSASS